MRRSTFWSVLLCACGMSFGAKPIEVSLSYKHMKLFRETAQDTEIQYLPAYRLEILNLGVPKGSWKLPKLKSKKPMWFTLNLAGTKYLCLFDLTGRGEKQSLKCFFDSDGDGDLTDDPPLKQAIEGEEGFSFSFGYDVVPEVKAEIPMGKKKIPYFFSLQLLGSGTIALSEQLEQLEEGVPRVVWVRSLSYFEGSFSYKGKNWKVVLVDSNINGTFDDHFVIPKDKKQAARARRSTSHDNIAFTTEKRVDYDSYVPFAGYVLFGKEPFRVKFDRSSKKLRLEPAREKLPELRLPCEVARLYVAAQNPANSAVVFDGKGSVPLPPDTYQVFSYQIRRKDAQGDLWLVEASTGSEKPRTFRAKPGVEIPFGEPFTVGVEPYVRLIRKRVLFGLLPGRSKPTLRLSLTLAGKGGAVVTNVAHVEGKRTKIPLQKRGYRPKAPTYQILSEKGELLAKGSFEYG